MTALDPSALTDLLGDSPLPGLVSGVTANSAEVRPGMIFAALRGTKRHGADFATDAVKAGAVAILTDHDAPDLSMMGVPVIRVAEPRLTLAKLAARLAGRQPECVVAVTGTAGKTSVAAFVRQIFAHAGLQAASIGTTGVQAPGRNDYGSLTTPDPVALHGVLNELAEAGVSHAAMEASSHGIDQHRLDGVRLSAAAFTNLGRDHLDYHPDMEAYLQAKLGLFTRLLPENAPAVVFADDAWSGRVIEAAQAAGRTVLTVGRKGGFIELKRTEHFRTGQRVELVHDGLLHEVDFPLAGDFQLWNGLVAAGLALAVGLDPKTVFEALETLEGAPGRLDLAGTTPDKVPVYVDYAHKPEALENVLNAVRPFTTGRIILVFGCGGDRDRGKRPIMGEIAGRLADLVIVTDDNPRSEEPAAIRAEILAAIPGATEIGDRAAAIREAIATARRGDTVIVAGKGHEVGQTIKGTVHHFSDHEEVAAAIADHAGKPLLWTLQDLVDATGGRPLGMMPAGVTGISIDSRTVEEGDAFFAIKGDNFDGHSFVTGALKAGAAILIVSEGKLPSLGRINAPLLVVDEPLAALNRLAVAARKRAKGQIIAVTGSVGKTTTKEALRHVLSADGSVHASMKSFNNHWGVPLSLARLPADARYAVFEIGMSAAGEIRALVGLVRPHISIITRIAPAHLGSFASIEGIAAAKAEIFEGVVEGGYGLINADDDHFAFLRDAAKAAGVDHIKTFGSAEGADYRISNWHGDADSSDFTVTLARTDHAVHVGMAGRHIAQNILAVIGAAHLAGADIPTIIDELATLSAADGRGVRTQLRTPRGVITLMDESYNANPVSMSAAIAVLGQVKPRGKGRRVAILGDMRELGEAADRYHAELADPLVEAGVDLVLCTGPHMAALKSALADRIECRHHDTIDLLTADALKALRAGDIAMVKSSNGTGTAKVVAALKEKYPGNRD